MTIKIAYTEAAISAAQDYATRTGTCIFTALTNAGIFDYCSCAGCVEEARMEAAAEWEAEQRNERWFEERGADACSGIPNYTDPQGGPCLCC